MDLAIATWNCFQGTDAKVPAILEAYSPDIAVVAESASMPAIAQPNFMVPAVPHLWTGEWPGKGLGIFAPTAKALRAGAVMEGRGEHVLSADVEFDGGGIGIIGVWTVPLNGTRQASTYIGALDDILTRHADILAAGRTAVAGDFNCSGQSDPHSFPDFFAQLLAEHGLQSAYHVFTGEAVGQETRPTLYWRHKEDAPFHCDFILVPTGWHVHDVQVGAFADWCAAGVVARSDHAPVVARVTAQD